MTNGPRPGHLTVSTGLSGDRVEIRIADEGPGFAREALARAFEPLYSTKNFGVGLGLPIVKQIVEQHGGGVEIDSEEGAGTRITLWLPHGGVPSRDASEPARGVHDQEPRAMR